MLNESAIDVLLEKLGTDGKRISRFELCSVASKRARQIIATRENEKSPFDVDALSMACQEIVEGKVIIYRN